MTKNLGNNAKETFLTSVFWDSTIVIILKTPTYFNHNYQILFVRNYVETVNVSVITHEHSGGIHKYLCDNIPREIIAPIKTYHRNDICQRCQPWYLSKHWYSSSICIRHFETNTFNEMTNTMRCKNKTILWYVFVSLYCSSQCNQHKN